MNARRFFLEVKRRNVYRAAAAYGVISWLVIQVATQVSPYFNIPNWAVRLLILLLIVGFPVALIWSWAFELTPEGIMRTEDVPTDRSVTRHTGRKLLAFAAVGAAISVALLLFRTAGPSAIEPKPAADTATIPEKSIAVLPFANLSANQENEFFTAGVQDEILTDLSKVADLKVISRSSSEIFKPGAARNLREIGQQLGVAHVLEGSVQRSANRIRVTSQLIDARTDLHLWAEHYDRDVTDAFAIQTEIAEAIVGQLRAKLSPSEKAAMERPPPDSQAFDLYLQAKQLIISFDDTPDWKETLLRAVRLLDEAISRDGTFALAYCWATTAHDNLYWFALDHTPARLAQAKAAAETALRLAPDLGEAHLARALVYYHGTRDYTRALDEVALAKRTLPNSAETYALAGYIERRQGRWDQARSDLEKAAELDPRNAKVINGLSVLYDILHDYNAKEALYDRTVVANPNMRDYLQLYRAATELEKADLAAARKLVDGLPSQYDPEGAATTTRLLLALSERRLDAAREALGDTKAEGLASNFSYVLPRSFFEGLIARAAGDAEQAKASFVAAHSVLEAKLDGRRDDALGVAMLGLTAAGQGNKEEAIALGRRAAELQPIANDAVDGATVSTALALIYAWTGEVNLAIEQLTMLSTIPGGPDYGQLRYDPAWDALRSDKRFEGIIEAARQFHR